MDDALLRCDAVTAGELRELSCAIARFGCHAVLGAGREAVLRLAEGTLRPERGRVLLAGAPPGRGAPPVLRCRAGADLPRNRSAAELMAEALRPLRLGVREEAARIARGLAALGLDTLEGRRPAQLSPERQARLALATALAPAPALLLLDDPWAGLDQATRLRLAVTLRGLLRGTEVTALLATPEPAEALAAADHVLALEDGACAQSGPPQALYEDPASATVASLVGELNRLPGTIQWLDAGECGVRLDGGAEVVARHADAGGPGSRCVVGLRPERVAVAAIAAADLGEGALPAALRHSIFMGDHVRLVLELPGGATLVAKRPPGTRLPRPGGPASVAWDADAARAFRALR